MDSLNITSSLYTVTVPAGPRKRNIIGIFADKTVAEDIAKDYTEASVEESTLWNGSAEAWRDMQAKIIRDAVIAKLTLAEQRVLNLV